MLRPFLSVLTCLSAAIVLSACLGSNYTVSSDELVRLANMPADDRGEEVRVTQRFITDPTPAATSEAPRGYSGGSSVVVVTHHHDHHRGPHTRRPTHTRSTDSGDDSNSSSMSAEAAIIVIAASAIVGLTLATSEGLRYDGWAQTPSDQPLYLVGPNGERYWVPLGKLDPGLAAWAVEGVIDEDDGPIEWIQRAPLYRAGMAFDLSFGAGKFAEPDGLDSPYAFFGRVGIGAFPIQEFGIMLGLDIGVSDHAEWRPHLELQIIPLALGSFHLGAYGQAGYQVGAVARGDGTSASTDSYYGGGGVLAQIDLTTRLALSLRLGAMVETEGDANVLPQASLGISVY